MCTDDTNILVSVNSSSALIERANSVVTTVKSWLGNNKLTLNAVKSQNINFHRKLKKLPLVPVKATVSGTELQGVQSTKFLEVFINEIQLWEKHVKTLSRNLAKYVHILCRMREVCNKRKSY